MEIKQQLLDFKSELDKELKTYLDQKITEAEKISPHAKELMEHIGDLTLRGGKRIRAALLYYSYIAHGGKNLKEALRAAMSVELSETYLLIHDDIMDNDILRRGGTTISESYRQIGEDHYHNKVNTRNFGNSIAMLAGNIASAMSNKILAERKFKPQFIARGLHELNRVYTIEQYGQMLDMLSEIRDDFTLKDVTLVHELKTVPYTFDGPMKLGAILAGASEKELNKLSEYAVPLGTAFQIHDDILGMFGSEEKLGKPVTSDLKEGKRTMLILRALAKANAKDKETIQINLGNSRATLNGLREIRRIIEETGALDYSKKTEAKLVDEAIKAMEKMKLKKEGKEFFLKVADYVIKREY